MHPRLLLIDSQLLEVPSQRTRTAAAVQAAVILVQRAAGDPGCADFGYQRQTVLIRLRRGFTSVWFLSDLLLIMLLI
jgi:hypothetical protein